MLKRTPEGFDSLVSFAMLLVWWLLLLFVFISFFLCMGALVGELTCSVVQE
eukprot:TRINITY_DN21241_c0_g1_i1.p2 TRINITY_DN21241_c0_g1~~TRINITY_DN21241_c0_g1_i1.p2  ORF type:complete len:51 (-),score=3.94 TRINITY_DN21241_c0_g1_i1:101-253(-)